MSARSVSPAIKPEILKYLDYREYLRDLFQYHKARTTVFSNRYIVKKAGCLSPSTLTNIIKGKRNVTKDTAERFAVAFQMKESERRYFLALVAFNQAPTLAEKEKCFLELSELQTNDESVAVLKNEHHEYFSSWWHPVIREAILLPDAKKSSIWLSQILSPAITPAQAKASLQLLKRIGLITKEKGLWKQKNKLLATDSHLQSILIAQFHRQMIQLGMDAITRFNPVDREISGTTLRIAKKDFPQLANCIRDFRKKLLHLAEASENADQVYQFNCQFFPVVTVDRPRRNK